MFIFLSAGSPHGADWAATLKWPLPAPPAQTKEEPPLSSEAKIGMFQDIGLRFQAPTKRALVQDDDNTYPYPWILPSLGSLDGKPGQ